MIRRSNRIQDPIELKSEPTPFIREHSCKKNEKHKKRTIARQSKEEQKSLLIVEKTTSTIKERRPQILITHKRRRRSSALKYGGNISLGVRDSEEDRRVTF